MSQTLDDDVRRSLARRVAVLRVSRLSGLITLVAALVLTVVWWNDPLPLGALLPWGPQWLVISGGLFFYRAHDCDIHAARACPFLRHVRRCAGSPRGVLVVVGL